MKIIGRYKVEYKSYKGDIVAAYFNEKDKMIDYVSKLKYYGTNEVQVYMRKYQKINIEREVKHWNPEKGRFE